MAGLYSATVREHFRNPRNRGTLPEPDVAHEGSTPVCGDRLRIEIRLDGGRVADARFRGDACAIAIASASILTDRVRDLMLEEAEALGDDDVVAALDADIPAGRRQCALLPLVVLRAGAAAYRARLASASPNG